MLLEINLQPLADNLFGNSPHFGVAELCLGLPLKLRVLKLHADDGGEPFAHILAREFVRFFHVSVFDGVVVESARQSGFKSGDVHAAFRRMDVVGKRQQRLVEIVSVLNGQINLHVLHGFG